MIRRVVVIGASMSIPFLAGLKCAKIFFFPKLLNAPGKSIETDDTDEACTRISFTISMQKFHRNPRKSFVSVIRDQ